MRQRKKPKYKWRGQVPFDKEGNQLDWYDSWLISSGKCVLRDWYSFDTKMKVTSFYRGRSAAGICLEDENGKQYQIFLIDFIDIVQNVSIELGGYIDGHWGFCKRGTSYGVYRIGDRQGE